MTELDWTIFNWYTTISFATDDWTVVYWAMAKIDALTA